MPSPPHQYQDWFSGPANHCWLTLLNRGKAVAHEGAKTSRKLFLGGLCALMSLSLSACSQEQTPDKSLTANTRIELVDWHVSGLWVINSPVCWIRVSNYNAVPIKEIAIKYTTYDYDGKPLDHGDYIIDGEVPPGTAKNFIELYIGLVNVDSDQLSVTLESVKEGGGH